MNDSINVDGRRTVLSAIILGTVGVFAFIVQPGLVQGFVSILGLTEAQANALAAWEMGGIALSTIFVIGLSRMFSWRILMAVSLLIAAGGNLLSAFDQNLEFLQLARFATGIGAGGIIGLSFAIIGLTQKPERNLALYLVSLLCYGAIGLWLMPTAFETIGLKGIFILWAILTLLALVTVRFLPKSSDSREIPSPTAVQFGFGFLIFALVGILAYNTAIGIAWANLFLIGLEAKPDEQSVANALLLSQFIAIPGALVAALMSDKFGRWLPYIFGILGGAAFLYMINARNTFSVFVFAVCGFNFLWNMVLPYILAAVNDMDEKSRMVTPAISMQMIGLFAGPFLGAIILERGGSFRTILTTSVSLLLISFVILAICLWSHGRKLSLKKYLS